jgi:hypothetical protein
MYKILLKEQEVNSYISGLGFKLYALDLCLCLINYASNNPNPQANQTRTSPRADTDAPHTRKLTESSALQHPHYYWLGTWATQQKPALFWRKSPKCH